MPWAPRITQDWEKIFDSLPDAASIHGRDFRIVRVNRRFAESVGMHPEKLVGRKCYEIFHATNAPVESCPHRRAVESGREARACLWEPRLNAHFEISCAPILNGRGQAVAVLQITREIAGAKNIKCASLEGSAGAERILQTLMNHVPAGITIADSDLRIVAMSRFGRILAGVNELPPSGGVERLFRFDGAPVDAEEMPLLRAIRRGEVVVDEELILKRPDGEDFIILLNAAPIRDGNGEITAGVSAWNDITTLKRFQETVQNQAEAMKAVFASMADGVVVFDSNGQVQHTNPRLCEMFGFDPAPKKVNVAEFLPDATRRDGQMSLPGDTLPVRVLRGEIVRSLPLKISRGGRRHFFIQVSASPLYREGRIVGGVAVIHDVTAEETLRERLKRDDADLRAINEKLKEQTAELNRSREELERRVKERTADLAAMNEELKREMEERRQTEEKYRQLVANAPAGIYEIDIPNLKILRANEAMCEVMGYSRGEILQLHPLVFLTKESRKSLFKRYQRILAGKKVSEIIECRVRTKSGAVLWVLMNGKIIFEDGKPVRATIIVHDITERKKYEAALRESENRLRFLSAELLTAQEKERKKIALEIHDNFGAHLAAIKYSLEQKLFEMKNGLPEHGKRISIENIITMVENSIADARSIMMDLRPSVLDDLGILATIGWFCREFQKTYAQVRMENEIDVAEEDIPDLLKVVIFRVLQEATSNMAKHSRGDRIDITLVKRAGRIHFSIADNGVGFDPQTKLSPQNPSRGLGLNSMRERVENSGGKFFLQAEPGRGTQITAEWKV